jgi:hypothetical protein
MKTGEKIVTEIDWAGITDQMHQRGYCIIPAFLSHALCDAMADDFSNEPLYRKTINMERFRFGKGLYKYFAYPLPLAISNIRSTIYPKLVPIANKWMEVLNIDKRFPGTLEALHNLCRANKQVEPTVLILSYQEGGFNTLHQDLYGDVYFPIQAVLFLDQKGRDYEGGEFVLTEQVPRAQSKAIVLTPDKGDMLLFTTNFRPVKGSKGYYRANMKHGVSEVSSGTRHTLGIIFHDAAS